ncbi:hypothetical protein F4X10_13100 [Candidatus Poribacteria bacterium]|nr:hypothetical protein [Candidatus Poribacteria bacterium]
MKPMNLNQMIIPLILTVLICAGFWLYTQWDLKKFEASLPKIPPMQTANNETVHAAPAEFPREITEVTESPRTEYPVSDTDLSPAAPTDVPADVSEETEADTIGSGDFTTEYPVSDTDLSEETEADTIGSGDFTDVSQDVPYDEEFVGNAFDDYNASLETDPDYAYQRLDDALREQYGDDPDVDILVQHTRQLNDGTATITSTLENLQAQMRLMVKNNHPPDALEEVRSALESLSEINQWAEDGAKIHFVTGARIEDHRQ